MSKDDFYIGYQEKAPERIARFLKSRVAIIAAVVVLAGLIFALGQQRFANSSFELGKLTEVEGVLHTNPYPILSVELAPGEFKEVLLLGFGKFGAEEGLLEIAGEQDLEGLHLRLQGTLVYYDGVTLMQLEPEVEGTYEVLGRKKVPVASSSLGIQTLQGEVVDPKCFFGVMKPGHGKIHRSCAVRCISGGIPPVFVSQDVEGRSHFVLVVTETGAPAHQEVLDIVGKPSELTGKVEQVGQWQLLYLESDKIVDLGTKSQVY